MGSAKIKSKEIEPKGPSKISLQTRQHLVAGLILLILPLFLYHTTILGGQQYMGNDVLQWRAGAESLIAHQEETGEVAHWAENMFSGMPPQESPVTGAQDSEQPANDTQVAESERPTGRINDYKAEDIDDPDVSRFVSLLDMHYPEIDRERVLGRAFEFGDPELIDKAYLRDMVGEHADVLAGYFEDVVNRYSNAVEQTVNNIYERAGGKQRWDQMSQAFTRNAPDAIKNIVRKLIDSSNPEEVHQGLDFIFDYSTQSGYVDSPAQRPGTTASAGGGDALSAEQFSKAVREIGGRNRNPKVYDTKVEQLRRRRALGIELGL